jgi:hypothetical protein
MLRLIRNLVRPYRKNLALVLAAMLVETLMSLAAPWPLKVELDNVVAGKRLPHLLNGFLQSVLGGKRQDASRVVGRDWIYCDCGDRSSCLVLRQLHQ